MNKIFQNEIRVRYGETDQMGFVYYGNYALYLEVARTELIRQLGYSYNRLEQEGIQLPVINMNVSYKKAAKYDDLLKIKTYIKGSINKKICFATEVFNEANKLICNAEVTLVFVNKTTAKIVTCPKAFEELLKTINVYKRKNI